MSVKSCERLDKSKVALTIEADAAAFEAAINKAYLQQRSKISVPGFRPGKARWSWSPAARTAWCSSAPWPCIPR